LKSSTPVLAGVRHFWSTQQAPSAPVVVAVSGGPDSVALLLALRETSSAPLVAAHLNHQLRGQESDADEAFVRDLVESLQTKGAPGLDFCSRRIDVAARAQETPDNLENAARRARYDWLTEVARERQARWVATGHTADDQAETVLHRLLRGSGLKGLQGIPVRRELVPGVEVVRPLLAVTRAEVLAFLREREQAFCEDRTNRDLARTRNRLRHELLPRLAEDFNPAIARILCRLAGQAQEIYQDVQVRARQLLFIAELPRAGPILVFERQRLNGAPRFLVRELFRLVWQREGWPAGPMTFEDWDQVAAVALGEAVAVDLPRRIHVQCRERVVQLVSGER
jgi:tRNA(Ile)-lysidine synthase